MGGKAAARLREERCVGRSSVNGGRELAGLARRPGRGAHMGSGAVRVGGLGFPVGGVGGGGAVHSGREREAGYAPYECIRALEEVPRGGKPRLRPRRWGRGHAERCLQA